MTEIERCEKDCYTNGTAILKDVVEALLQDVIPEKPRFDRETGIEDKSQSGYKNISCILLRFPQNS